MARKLLARQLILKQSPIWLTIFADMTTNLMLFFLIVYIYHYNKEFKMWGELRGKIVIESTRYIEDESMSKFYELLGEQNVEKSADEIKLLLGDKVLFDSGKAELKAGALKELSQISDIIACLPENEIRIEGHTDDLPIKSGVKYESNWELSSARALSVLKFIENHFKKAKTKELSQRELDERMEKFYSQTVIAGYGEYHPLMSNSTQEGRARNRRIEIVVRRIGK